MSQRLRDAWEKWRESRRRYAIEAALYKARGGVAPHEVMGAGVIQAESPVEPYKPVSDDQSPFKKAPPPTGPSV